MTNHEIKKGKTVINFPKEYAIKFIKELNFVSKIITHKHNKTFIGEKRHKNSRTETISVRTQTSTYDIHVSLMDVHESLIKTQPLNCSPNKHCLHYTVCAWFF